MLRVLKEKKFKKAFRKMGGKAAGGANSFSSRACATIEEGVSLGHIRVESPVITIGAHSYIRSGTKLSVISEIGRFCSIGSECTLGQEKHTHPTDWVSTHPFQYETGNLSYSPNLSWATVGHDVWIGHGATILEGVEIGTGAIIATRAVVTKNIPPYAIVGGNPAKIIKYRHSPEVIERLLKSEWWNYDIEYLRRLPLNNADEFLKAIELNPSPPKAQYLKLDIANRKAQQQLIAKCSP
ncbi:MULTISPECIES: CatB-related O-acetyltransferase [Pseudomonas]|uniref:Transferase n=1 Tax=Pseudomonas hunanensis TaxID=1247546 RepID=A0ACC9MXF3_9PSED|nr:CatB-related O-acetyltransferase [Pseudomonas hunanensis]PKF23702.1 transferase [Pseudomonas hunanensis]TXI83733.1 MAG: CatB-related O-acetyltransferase [Cupriavidus sp.]